MTRIASLLLVLLVASAPARAQSTPEDFASLDPFAMGRLAGQITWITNNCGGKASNAAVKHYERANARNKAEFMKGVQAGIRDWEDRKIAMGGNVTALCPMARMTYAPDGFMPGLWDR